ncbi:hypothetical protein DFH09DRAFT_1344413 [Mycena vulgaris]|nr:hypothetical protein DFH09DRAFT_1344413 [Mycena vulgaris]
MPPFWPASTPHGIHLTEVVLGIQMPGSTPKLTELKMALESAPLLTRLGFYSEFPYTPPEEPLVSAGQLLISLPALTSLSVRHLPTDFLGHLLAMLVVPNFSDLTIAWDLREIAPGQNVTNARPVDQLHRLELSSALRRLKIHSLSQACDPTFFQPFHNLQTLGLDFSSVALSAQFWAALVDLTTHGPTFLPKLQHLTLVGIDVIHAQEIVLLRQKAGQLPLQLELVLQEREA